MSDVSTPRIQIVLLLAFCVATFGSTSQADAACSPNAPVNNSSIVCSGVTSGQNGSAGYGTNADSGNTITVQSGASVTGTSFGLILRSGAVDNFGGVFGAPSNPTSIGIHANSITLTNFGTVSGGTSGTGIVASAIDVGNSGNIQGGTTGINAAAASVSNSGVITGRTTGIRAIDADVSNSGNINGAAFGIFATGSASINNSGNIAAGAAGAAIAANTANVANSGAILGAVGISAQLASNIFNSGTVVGVQGTAINFLGAGNTLTLGPGSRIEGTAHGFGADTFQLGGAGVDAFNASQFATQYSGYARFNKIGSSIWSLTGTSTAAMPWTVHAGALNVNGNLANSSMTVSAGGTLGGDGIVGDTFINGGTLAPGNLIGLLTVQGSLTFAAASTYMVEVSSITADRTHVTGLATLGGSTVTVVFLPGSFVNKQYLILNAAGGISGTFNPVVTSNLETLQSTLTYGSNDVFLNIDLAFVPSPGGIFSTNQQNVANTLVKFFNSTGSIPAAFAGLSAGGLTVASGELGTGAIQSSIQANDVFLSLLLDLTAGGRLGGFASGGSASQFVANDEAFAQRQAAPRVREAFAAVSKAPALPARPANPWSVWAASYGGSAAINGNLAVGTQDLRARIWGIAAGADYMISPDTMVGFALAGGGTSFSLANGLGSGSSDLFQAGAFARHNAGPAYASAALAFGWHDVTTNRAVALAGLDLLQARYKAEALSGRAEAGYHVVTPLGGVAPYAAVQAISFGLPAYAEQILAGGGMFALNYGAQTTTDIRSELGFRSDKSFALQDATLTLRGRVAWAYDYNLNRAVPAFFQELPGASFVVNGARPDPTSALVSAGAEMKWRNGLALAATFHGEFSGNSNIHSGKAVLHYAW